MSKIKARVKRRRCGFNMRGKKRILKKEADLIKKLNLPVMRRLGKQSERVRALRASKVP